MKRSGMRSLLRDGAELVDGGWSLVAMVSSNCRMQNAECRMERSRTSARFLLHSAFIFVFIIRVPYPPRAPSQVRVRIPDRRRGTSCAAGSAALRAARSACGSALSFATALVLSFMSPKTMACGRAGLLAGGDDFAVADAAALLLGLDLRGVDALHAVRALLHHAARADGDVGVAHRLERRRVVVGVVEEVEAADLVRAVVRAVARADAAVVRHVVQAVVAVRGGLDRADRLARRVLALHARHRLVEDFRVVDVAAVVAVDAQPVHLALAHHFFLADDGDVVLRLAGDHAAVAAGADARVDDHRPGVLVAVVPRRVHRLVVVPATSLPWCGSCANFGFCLIALERGRADDAALADDLRIDRLVLLRAGDRIRSAARRRHGDAARPARRAARSRSGADRC